MTFRAWGYFVHRHRRAVLLGSAALLALSVVGALRGGVLSSANAAGQTFQSTRASNLIDQEIAASTRAPQGGSSFLLILRRSDTAASDPAFQADVERAVRPLRDDHRVVKVVTPYDVAPQRRAAMTSKDGHAVLVQVYVRDRVDRAAGYYGGLRAEVGRAADGMSVSATGQVPIQHSMNATLERDLRRAEVVSLPVTLLLLILIFGTLIAAGLPLAVGLLTILGGIGATLALAHVTDVSQYALNIVTLIGLGVSIDYSLFVVTRFREELRRGVTTPDALATTVATAGRAITFSGVTVAIGLGALLFFPGTYLTSMGFSGMIVVATAVVYGLTFLPAVLALLGPRVERLRVPLRRRRPGGGPWPAIARAVMRRPLLALVPTLAVLLLAGVPFLHIRLAGAGLDQLPPGSPARAGYEQLQRDFPGQTATTFPLVVRYPSGDVLSRGRVDELYDLGRRVAAIPGVTGVEGPTELDPSMDRAAYERLYAQPRSALPPAVRQAVDASVGSHIAVLTATTQAEPTSDAARAILSRLRAEHVDGGEILVGGQTATDRDIIDFVLDHIPAAVGFAVGVTLVVLFLLTGSVTLPIKAVLSNMVSISASFGALVWIFQDGHLSAQLGFTPQSLDPSIPVLLFATVFGLSMDYEVLLVTRIQEQFRATGDNDRAVLTGLARSGGMITGAAAIMLAVFLAFGTSQIMLIKALGLGLSIAVLLDATLLRGLVVPAVMRLMGRANWWAPRPLRWLHDRVGIGEGEPPAAAYRNGADVDKARLVLLMAAAARRRESLPTPFLKRLVSMAGAHGENGNGTAPAPRPSLARRP